MNKPKSILLFYLLFASSACYSGPTALTIRESMEGGGGLLELTIILVVMLILAPLVLYPTCLWKFRGCEYGDRYSACWKSSKMEISLFVGLSSGYFVIGMFSLVFISIILLVALSVIDLFFGYLEVFPYRTLINLDALKIIIYAYIFLSPVVLIIAVASATKEIMKSLKIDD